MVHRVPSPVRPVRWVGVTTVWFSVVSAVPMASWITLCEPEQYTILAVIGGVLATGAGLGGLLGLIARRWSWRAAG